MIASLSNSTQRFLNELKSINARLDQAQRQVASTKRIEVASDDPDSVANLVSAQADLDRLAQVTTNLQRVTSEVNNSEQTMQSAVSVFEKVRVLASQATSTTMTASTRTGLADQIGALMKQMVGLANTQVNGRYVFAGDSDQTMPFTMDLTQTPPWSLYQGSAATRQVMDAKGTKISIARDGGEIFDNTDATKNVFQSMENLRQALLTNDDAGIRAAIDPLKGVLDHLNVMLASYGYVQDQLSSASAAAQQNTLQLKTDKSSIEDADVTEAIVTMQQLKFSQQAAMQTRSAIPNKSLFDYMG